MNLVHNEQTKLSATWLNGIAIAAVAVGGIAPTIAIASGTLGALTGSVLAAFWVSVGVGLHIGARGLLRGLKDDEP